MKRKCDSLQFDQRTNKREILDILSATNSVEQHVYLSKDSAPEKIQAYAKKTNNILAKEEQERDLWKHKRVSTATGIAKAKVGLPTGQPNILRTVYMPNEQATSAQKEANKLNQQIDEQRMQFEGVISSLRDQKIAFEEQNREKYLK